MAGMQYRRLGRSGIQVSVLSFGSWVTFGPQVKDVDGTAVECMQAAYDAGVNFFDNAEVYDGGRSEEIMGSALAKLDWDRRDYLVSSKFFWGIHEGPFGGVNTKNTLNRKYLLDAVTRSLERFQLDFLDLAYCHRPDPETPLEETVRAMSDIVERGYALYWGTSEWSADEIRGAIAIADKRNLHAPVVEQPQYNLFFRDKVDKEYARLFDEHGIGTTTWSPLASGLLSGKYLDGIPEGSRATLPGYEWLKHFLTDEDRNAKVRSLKAVADELGCTLAQLSIAWCAANPNVSTVITGASRVEQVHENMRSLEALEQLDAGVLARIDEIMAA